MAVNAISTEKRTIGEAKEKPVIAEPKKSKKPNKEEFKANNMADFFKEIGLDATPDQLKACESHLRMKVSHVRVMYQRAVDSIPPDIKLGRQQKALVESLSFDRPMSSEEWANEASKHLETCQEPIQVLNFYKRTLEKKGLVKPV